jgi:SAM-dependent methyltransferase
MTLNGYAAVDRRSRLAKARKIEALLGDDVDGLDLLDLGAGSGLLADYFKSRGANVTAADREDSAYGSPIPFVRIEGETLPFADASFDVVIFNHVIEHVGVETRQTAVLSEIKRVLKPGGKLYLAAPNKWAIIEPHFRLPLLGAMPRGVANFVVKMLRGDPKYDCYPLTRGRLGALARSCFPQVQDKSGDAVIWVAENELRGIARKVLSVVPTPLLRALWPAYPTFIMVARK